MVIACHHTNHRLMIVSANGQKFWIDPVMAYRRRPAGCNDGCQPSRRRLRCRSFESSRDAPTVAEPATTLLFFTTIEVAERLRISRRTLERMRVEGTGPRYIKVGPGKRSRVLYREADVVAWIDKYQFGSTSEYAR